MYSRGDACPSRCEVQLMVYLEFVECVAAFVDSSEHRGLEVLRLIPRCDSHVIPSDSYREGMRGNILPESLPRHVKHRREFLVYLFQRFNIIVGFFQGMLLRKFSLR